VELRSSEGVNLGRLRLLTGLIITQLISCSLSITPKLSVAILALVPLKWKLKEFLADEGITAYRLADETHGQLSQKSVYHLVSGNLKGIRFESLEAIVPALRRLSGKPVNVQDLLEYVADEAPD
jgi:DNA-binding Xre family transcriptional regulator